MAKFKIIEKSSNNNAKSMVIAGTCIIDAIFGIYFENHSYDEIVSSSLSMIYRKDAFDPDLITLFGLASTSFINKYLKSKYIEEKKKYEYFNLEVNK